MRNQEETVQNLVLKIFRLDDVLKKLANQITAPNKQTGARWQVMNALDDGPKTVAEIARVKNVARQSIQRLAEARLKMGLRVPFQIPHINVIRCSSWTAKGRKALLDIQKSRNKWLAEITKSIDSSQGEQALRFLDEFEKAVVKTLKS